MVAADAAETGGRIACGAARVPAARAAPAREGNARIETRRGPRRGKKTEEGRSTKRIETRRRTKHKEERRKSKTVASQINLTQRRGERGENRSKIDFRLAWLSCGLHQRQQRPKVGNPLRSLPLCVKNLWDGSESKREKRRHPKREEAQGAGPRGAGCRMEGGFPRLINEDQSLREVNARETCVYFRMGRRRFSLVGGGATAADLV